MTTTVPASRIRALNAHPLNPRGDFVLYWMVAARRTRWNFALQHAVDLCVELDMPLLILEALDVDYPWASDRLHRFVLDGMAANRAACRRSRAAYYPYVEPAPRRGRGLIAALSRHACAIVTDHFPAFFIPRIAAARGAPERGAGRGGRFEWPDPAGGARPRVHDRALVPRLRAA